jgi:uncharacterized protein (TIGR03503 family)
MKITDPKKLRAEAARSLIEGLNSRDRVALVEFSDVGKDIRGLTDSASFEMLKLDLAGINDNGEFTDVLMGLSRAREILTTYGRADAQKIVLLVSDGKMDPRPEVGSQSTQSDKLMNQEIPNLRNSGVRVYSIGFSKLADQKLLTDISSMTGGKFEFSPEASGLVDAFGSLAKEIDLTISQPIPDLPVAGKISRAFRISEGLDEIIFYINRGRSAAVRVVTPRNKTYSKILHPNSVSWHQEGRFDFITIREPEGGDWIVSGLESKDNFATVLSNLKLGIEFSTIEVGIEDPVRLEARFYESRKPINLPELFKTMKYSFQVVPLDRISEPVIRGNLHDDGKDGDVKAKDGTYATEFALDESGNYKVVLQVDGPVISQEHVANFKVIPRLLNIEIVDSQPESSSEHGSVTEKTLTEVEPAGGAAIKIALSQYGQAVKDRSLKLKITNSSGASRTIPVPGKGSMKTEFFVPLTALQQSDTYEIQALLAGSQRGKLISASSNKLTHTYTVPVKPVAKSSRSKSSSHGKNEESSIFKPFILTLVNLLCGLLALSLIKKHLAKVVVEQERFVSPDGAIRTLAELDKRYEAAEVNLKDPAFSIGNINKILEKAALTEDELQAAIVQGVDDLSTANQEALSDQPATAAAEPVANTQITEAEVKAEVESEVDEETKKLLEQVSEQVEKMKS